MYLIISPSLFSSTSQPMLISLGLQKFDTLKMSETKEDVESATTLSSISNLTEEVPKKLEELLATPAGDPEATTAKEETKKGPWPIDRQREDDSPTIEEGHLDDYVRSEQEAVKQTLELMKKTAGVRDMYDTASLKEYGVGPLGIMSIDRVMSDDNCRAVFEQCARREGIDHGEDLSKVGPEEVSVTPANHKEDTKKESPDVAKPSPAAVSVGKAQLKNNVFGFLAPEEASKKSEESLATPAGDPKATTAKGETKKKPKNKKPKESVKHEKYGSKASSTSTGWDVFRTQISLQYRHGKSFNSPDDFFEYYKSVHGLLPKRRHRKGVNNVGGRVKFQRLASKLYEELSKEDKDLYSMFANLYWKKL